mgnify:CR=1 FL=1
MTIIIIGYYIWDIKRIYMLNKEKPEDTNLSILKDIRDDIRGWLVTVSVIVSGILLAQCTWPSQKSVEFNPDNPLCMKVPWEKMVFGWQM